MSTATAKTDKGCESGQDRAVFELAGLCVSCAKVETCMNAGCREGGIWHCEEFDQGPAPRDIALRDATDFENETPEETPLVGLCQTCEDRGDCAQARKTGGVWHCELFV